MISLISSLPAQLPEQLINKLPKVLKPALQLIPFSVQKSVLLKALHSVFSEAITDGDFEFLVNKWLKISVKDLNIHWLLSYRDNQLIMAPTATVNEDVSFSANGDDLLLIAGRKVDPDTLFFQRRLVIEGDTELGLEVKNLIDAIDLEQLPSLIHQGVSHCAEILIKYRQDH